MAAPSRIVSDARFRLTVRSIVEEILVEYGVIPPPPGGRTALARNVARVAAPGLVAAYDVADGISGGRITRTAQGVARGIEAVLGIASK